MARKPGILSCIDKYEKITDDGDAPDRNDVVGHLASWLCNRPGKHLVAIRAVQVKD